MAEREAALVFCRRQGRAPRCKSVAFTGAITDIFSLFSKQMVSFFLFKYSCCKKLPSEHGKKFETSFLKAEEKQGVKLLPTGTVFIDKYKEIAEDYPLRFRLAHFWPAEGNNAEHSITTLMMQERWRQW